ncbi:hypothetical protein BGZ61DRAFT_521959 [Ilyonectria robusta]|uniref:uncharacterized protein n=1 Tax=Ilyonectria robusta TaxID=1079257 RepID=UPI001E8DA573|nr:uncharacterized protein BGZ61DRAFT_521959 [Ilyonectria robusta]KAH8669275.1 hypothetical protein BGZ61DRAFT_521959 [Ilyonectria robusta]
MERHPGPTLIFTDAEKRVGKNDALVQARSSTVQNIVLTYGYDDRLRLAVQGVTGLDGEKLQATWRDPDGKDCNITTSPFDIVKSKLLPGTMRKFVEGLSPSSVKKFVNEHFSELKPIHQILNSLTEDYKQGIVKKALDSLIAYRLATSMVVSDGTDAIFESGLVDAETSRLHGQTVVSPLINANLRLIQLQVWLQLRSELFEELSKTSSQTNEKWLVMLILLLNLEDVEFDCKFRDLTVRDVEKASAELEQRIQEFLIDSNFTSESLDTGDASGKAVRRILDDSIPHKKMIIEVSEKDLSSAFDSKDVNSVAGLHTFKLLRKSLNIETGKLACHPSLGTISKL